jgi:hypothetical protein
MSDKTTNDLLCQLVEGQAQLLGEFREHKGKTDAKIESLESDRKWNRIVTYVVTPFLMVGTAVARHLGAKI